MCTVEGSILIQKSADKQLFPKIYPLFGEKLQITIVVPLSFFIFVKEKNPFWPIVHLGELWEGVKKWDQKSQNRSSNDPVGRKSNNKGAKFQHRFLDKCIETPIHSFKCAI